MAKDICNYASGKYQPIFPCLKTTHPAAGERTSAWGGCCRTHPTPSPDKILDSWAPGYSWRGQGVEGGVLDDDGLVLMSLLQTSVISWGNSRLSLEGLNWRWWPAEAKPQLEGNYVFFGWLTGEERFASFSECWKHKMFKGCKLVLFYLLQVQNSYEWLKKGFFPWANCCVC